MDSLWLVRLPENIALSFSQVAQGGTAGYMETGEDGKLRIRVSDTESYNLEELNGGPQVLAFDADATHKSFTFKGAVTKSYTMKPSDMLTYQSIVRKRSEIAAERPSTQHIRKTDVMESSIIDFVPPVTVQLKLQAEDLKQVSKKAKLSIQEEVTPAIIQRKIFEMFKKESSGRVVLKTLLAYCRSEYLTLGEKELKDELEKYAEYNRKGPNRGTWELRADYALKDA